MEAKFEAVDLVRTLLESVCCQCLQIITEYKRNQLSVVLDALERMHAHLTAAVVSNDPLFLQVRLMIPYFLLPF